MGLPLVTGGFLLFFVKNEVALGVTVTLLLGSMMMTLNDTRFHSANIVMLLRYDVRKRIIVGVNLKMELVSV